MMVSRLLVILLGIASLLGAEETKAMIIPHDKKICLNMIVRDETSVIERCLLSVIPLIDYWVIVDTGSTDGTQEVIRNVLKDIPGELYEREWVNFGHNRQEALELAKNKGEYILFMDADDFLKFHPDFKMPKMVADFYAIPSCSSVHECLLPRLIKASLNWSWHGVVHEWLLADPSPRGELLQKVEYAYCHQGIRSRDPDISRKDIELLLSGLKEEPDNARYLFYLGLEYFNVRDFKTSRHYFEKRIEQTGGNDEEVFVSKMTMARIDQIEKKPAEEIKKQCREAYQCRPVRMEPLYFLAEQERLSENYEQAYQYASKGLLMPIVDSIFVEKWIYDYGMLFEYALAAFHTNRYAECVLACDRLLSFKELPEGIRYEVRLLRYHLSKMNHKEICAQYMKKFFT